MKQFVLQGVEDLQVVEKPIPVPGPGEVVIKIKYAGICGSDIHLYYGQNPNAKLPIVMGHEAMGTITAINSDRDDLKIGDKVCSHTVLSCQSCNLCMTGHENLCRNVRIMGTNLDGIFAEYVLVKDTKVIKFDPAVDDRTAALVEPLTVGVHDTFRAGVHPGDKVFIAGAGPIGLIIALMSRLAGASTIVLSEIDDTRKKIAADMGFKIVCPNDSTFFEDCLTYSDGTGYDKAFEITSSQSGFDACLQNLKKGGTHIQVGMPPKGTRYSLDSDKLIYSECNILGVRHHTMSDMLKAAEIINSGILNNELKGLVSAVYPASRVREAFDAAKNEKTLLRVLLDFENY